MSVKIYELKPEELASGLTPEQKKSIFLDYIKANKEDADAIIKSDLPSITKKELTDSIEEYNSKVQEQIKEVGESVKSLEKAIAERRTFTESNTKSSMSLGEVACFIAKTEIRKKGIDQVRITPEEINKYAEYQAINKAAGAGLEEGDFSEGGALLTPEYSAELLKTGYETAGLVSLARDVPMQSNSITFKYVKDWDHSSGYVSGGVIVYWTDKETAPTASKPVFGQLTLKLSKLMGLAYSDMELIEDSPISIEAQLRSDFTDAFAMAMDDGMINGTGAGELQGIASAACTYSVAIETGQTLAVNPIEYANILNMWASMTTAGKRRAVWVVNPDLWKWLPKMNLTVGHGGIPVFLPASGAAGAPTPTLFGRPVIENECSSALGTVGDICFADFSQYLLGRKSNSALRYETSMHLKFDTDEMAFKFVWRMAGMPAQADKKTPRRGGTYRSAFITLAART
ncbi:MAG: hypothetical protein QG588_788 [Candidatus Poribacteria bacterium]|nr:hypothetical protein [Candidatus Poribacteria bacterium]